MAAVSGLFRGLVLSVVRCSLTTSRVNVERENALNNKVSDGVDGSPSGLYVTMGL